MALSYVRAVGDGTTTLFGFSFDYLSADHLGVKVDGVDTAFTLSSAYVVSVSPAPADGAVVEVRRTTPAARLVTFTDGTVLVADDLNLSAVQNLFITQEAADKANDTIAKNALGVFDALGARITNVGDAVVDTDFPNYGQMTSIAADASASNDAAASHDASAASHAASAASHDASSAVHESNAASYASSANSNRVQTGLDAAATSADRVQTGLDAAATAADRVQTGSDKTATAADRVQTGADRTATAADRVQTGLDATATAADRVQTGLDAAATAADRVQTGLDAASAAASAAAAATFDPSSYYTKTQSDALLNGKATPSDISSAISALNKSSVGLDNVDNTSDATKNTASATLENKTIRGTKEMPYAITDAPGFAVTPSQGGIQTITLGANRTPVATGFENGHSVLLGITCAGFSVTWTTMGVVWIGGAAPTLGTRSWIELWMSGGTLFGAYVGDA